MIVIEVPVRTLDDEIAALQKVESGLMVGKSTTRVRLHAQIQALRWVRDGGTRPSEKNR